MLIYLDSAFDWIDYKGHDETAHFLSPDLILHIQQDVYRAEIWDGETYYDCRNILRHVLKHFELFRAAAKVLPQLRYVEVESRTESWTEISMARIETTYKDDKVWVGKHTLQHAIEHRLDRGLGL